MYQIMEYCDDERGEIVFSLGSDDPNGSVRSIEEMTENKWFPYGEPISDFDKAVSLVHQLQREESDFVASRDNF